MKAHCAFNLAVEKSDKWLVRFLFSEKIFWHIPLLGTKLNPAINNTVTLKINTLSRLWAIKLTVRWLLAHPVMWAALPMEITDRNASPAHTIDVSLFIFTTTSVGKWRPDLVRCRSMNSLHRGELGKSSAVPCCGYKVLSSGQQHSTLQFHLGPL